MKFLRVLWLCLHHDDAAKVNTETFPSFIRIICPAVLSKYAALYINKATFIHIYARHDAFAGGYLFGYGFALVVTMESCHAFTV